MSTFATEVCTVNDQAIKIGETIVTIKLNGSMKACVINDNHPEGDF